MNTFKALFLILVLALSAFGISGTPVPELEGSWRVKEAKDSGEPVKEINDLLTIRGNIFERVTPVHTFIRVLKIDATKDPAWIDLHVANEPGKGEVFLGIYEQHGDYLKICHARPGRPRPTEFSSTPENRQILSVSRRVGPLMVWVRGVPTKASSPMGL